MYRFLIISLLSGFFQFTTIDAAYIVIHKHVEEEQ
jgi:uncharacterized membrane protein YtjA (UPF0391 family)